jgi:hypothetical protein
MNPIYDLFCQHPHQEGMTYFQHLRRAFSLSGQMLYGSMCLCIHGLIPAYFERTGTTIIHELYHDTKSKKINHNY